MMIALGMQLLDNRDVEKEPVFEAGEAFKELEG